MRTIAKRRMPVFGIGVGMQLLNVSQGGTLLLHIPEDMPKALPHKDPLDPAHRHGLEVVPGSLMERVYGDGEIRVNSVHHMAVDDVAPGFSGHGTLSRRRGRSHREHDRLVGLRHAIPSRERFGFGARPADFRGVHHGHHRRSPEMRLVA